MDPADYRVGKGGLAGKAVYAGRDFQAGELILKYNWRELTTKDWANLSDQEKQFAHSFWGRTQLFLPPERYVNHSDRPNTKQDLAALADRAVRFIKQGEEITTDASLEIKNELESLLAVYWQAINSRDIPAISGLLFSKARFNGGDSESVDAKNSPTRLRGLYELVAAQTVGSKPTVNWVDIAYDSASCTCSLAGNQSQRVSLDLKRVGG